MILTLLIPATLTCVIWCLWVRRETWGSPWDTGTTLGVGLLGLALTLTSPAATHIVGPILHEWIMGGWQCEDFIGHLCSLAGWCCLAYSTLDRIARDDDDLTHLVTHLIGPVIYTVPLMFAAFMLSEAEIGHHVELLDTPPDGWLRVYWCVYSVAKLWLAAVVMWALRIARSDARSRHIVTCYLVGSVASILRSVMYAANAFTELPLGHWVWFFGCAVAITFATASAASWRARIRFSSGDDQSAVDA